MNDPVLIAYSAKRHKGLGRAHWRRIGAAYPHDEGAGLTIILDLIPLDGRIILLERDDADDRRLGDANRFSARFPPSLRSP